MIETIVWFLIGWFTMSFLLKFIQNYQDISDEIDSEDTIKVVFLQIDVEHLNGLWYGWYVSDEQEAFVAQGTTYDEAVLNCKNTLERKNPEFKIVFRFEKKRNEQPAL